MLDVTYTLPKSIPFFIPLVEKGCKLFKVDDTNHIHLDIPHGALGISLWGLLDYIILKDGDDKLTKFTWSFNKQLRAKQPLPRAAVSRRVSTVKPPTTPRKDVREAYRAKRAREGKRIHT